MAEYARGLIEQLGAPAGGTAEVLEEEPLFKVEDVRDEPGGYDFEIGLGDEIQSWSSMLMACRVLPADVVQCWRRL